MRGWVLLTLASLAFAGCGSQYDTQMNRQIRALARTPASSELSGLVPRSPGAHRVRLPFVVRSIKRTCINLRGIPNLGEAVTPQEQAKTLGTELRKLRSLNASLSAIPLHRGGGRARSERVVAVKHALRTYERYTNSAIMLDQRLVNDSRAHEISSDFRIGIAAHSVNTASRRAAAHQLQVSLGTACLVPGGPE
jgi:hypothetical protein